MEWHGPSGDIGINLGMCQQFLHHRDLPMTTGPVQCSSVGFRISPVDINGSIAAQFLHKGRVTFSTSFPQLLLILHHQDFGTLDEKISQGNDRENVSGFFDFSSKGQGMKEKQKGRKEGRK